MTSDIRLVVRESREQTRQARVTNASLKIIALGTTLLSLAILIGVIYLLKDILALGGNFVSNRLYYQSSSRPNRAERS